jgi:DNA repair exonuclease SbcCD ATPase subunit
MHITRLEVENVKRLEAVQIKPNGDMVVIGGSNGQGKSSVLDSIEYALAGKKSLPKVPIHNGAEKGHIILETEEYTVKRSFTGKDSYIEVKTKEGYKITTPQELLDKLCGDLSFDPLAFTRLDSKKQAQVLMRLLGLDFTALDAEYQKVTEERRDIGRDANAVKPLLDSIPEDPDAPKEEVVVSELMNKLMEANQTNEQNDAIRQEVEGCKNSINKIDAHIADLKRQLQEFETLRTKQVANLNDAESRAKACKDIDTTPITEQINNAQAINRRVQQAKQREKYVAQYTELTGLYDKKTARLREIEAEKSAQIAAAKFPVEGVSFSSEGILVNGIPFDQASSAEQLRIAVAMGLSSNPTLKIILVRDSSLLDENSLKAMAEMAEQYGAQVWMERVGEGKEVSVVIKDGRIAEDRTAPTEEPALLEVN